MTEVAAQYFDTMARHGVFSSARRLRFYTSWLFRDADFTDRRVLDIGGGSGIFTFYAAASGARLAVCLEPEGDGRHHDHSLSFDDLAADLGLAHARRSRQTLEDYDGKDGPFDIIVLHNSINHLDQTACTYLREGGRYRARYVALACKVAALAAPGCMLILSDCSGRNFFHDVFAAPSPFAPTIDWTKHQPPEIWAELFSTAGFADPEIRWMSPNRLGLLGAPLRCRGIQYFLSSYFVLTMTRTTASPGR